MCGCSLFEYFTYHVVLCGVCLDGACCISSISVFSCWIKQCFIYRWCVVSSCCHCVYSRCEIFGYQMFFIIYVEVYFLEHGVYVYIYIYIYIYLFIFINAAPCSLHFRKYSSTYIIKNISYPHGSHCEYTQ